MKPIYGTIAARRKDKPGREGKVGQENRKHTHSICLEVFLFIFFWTAILGPYMLY